MRHIGETARMLPVLFAIALSHLTYGADAKTVRLAPKDIEDGWILLFDGSTTFGWAAEGATTVEDGALIIGGEKAAALTNTTEFGVFELRFEAKGGKGAAIMLDKMPHELGESKDWAQYAVTVMSKDDSHTVLMSRGKEVAANALSMNHPGPARMKLAFQTGPGVPL